MESAFKGVQRRCLLHAITAADKYAESKVDYQGSRTTTDIGHDSEGGSYGVRSHAQL